MPWCKLVSSLSALIQFDEFVGTDIPKVGALIENDGGRGD